MKRNPINYAIAAVDLILFFVIAGSVLSGSGRDRDPGYEYETTYAMQQTTRAAKQSTEAAKQPTGAAQKTAKTPQQTTGAAQQAAGAARESVPDAAPPAPETPRETYWWDADEPSPAEADAGYDSNVFGGYDTSQRPKLSEFGWVNRETLNGSTPEGATPLSFDDIQGGWKCYIIDLPMSSDDTVVERLLNVYISGTASETTVLFDWYFMRMGTGNEGFTEETDPSVFTGNFGDGRIDATGPGNIELTKFYSADGHQYAVGRLHWPDGYTGEMALVRP